MRKSSSHHAPRGRYQGHVCSPVTTIVTAFAFFLCHNEHAAILRGALDCPLMYQSGHSSSILVLAHYADAFAKAWIDLGYNALGEPGVVRCDLFSVDSPGSATDAPRVFLSRKVFKAAADVTAHERSEHFMAWSARVQSMLGEEGLTGEREELGTVYPLSSPFPFRSRWQTV
eukprot:scaffold185313_cov36-Tisochrysis_lutea.AAC.1